MEFNKLVSLVVGFVILILLFVWISNQFRANTKTPSKAVVTITLTPSPTKQPQTNEPWNPLGFLFRKTSPTPSLTQIPSNSMGNLQPQSNNNTITPVQIKIIEGGIGSSITQDNQQKTQQNNPSLSITNNPPTHIPETGASTILLPLTFSALTLGMYLRKKA